MLRRDLIDEPQVWASMTERFPWVVEERGEIGEGLVHLDFAALRQGVERAADDLDSVTARDILAFVEQLLTDPLKLHPGVENAIAVSFIEDLYLNDQHVREFVEPLLGSSTLRRWNEVKNWSANESG
jgi:hypothetical protein